MMILFFLRGKAEEKRRDFSLQKKKRTKAATKKEKIPQERISYEQHKHTQHSGKKEQRENSD